MKKLLFSIVPLMISSSVFAELSFDDAYWIIKDGKLTDNVEVWDYDPEKLEDKIPNVIADTTVNGENVVVYKQISQDFLDVRLKFNAENPLDKAASFLPPAARRWRPLMLRVNTQWSISGAKQFISRMLNIIPSG